MNLGSLKYSVITYNIVIWLKQEHEYLSLFRAHLHLIDFKEESKKVSADPFAMTLFLLQDQDQVFYQHGC